MARRKNETSATKKKRRAFSVRINHTGTMEDPEFTVICDNDLEARATAVKVLELLQPGARVLYCQIEHITDDADDYDRDL